MDLNVYHNEIVDDDLCLFACVAVLEKYWLWTDEKQQRLYDLVIKGFIPQSKDNKAMLCAAFWLTRFLLISFLKKDLKVDFSYIPLVDKERSKKCKKSKLTSD